MRRGSLIELDMMKNADCAFMVCFAVTITHNLITQEKKKIVLLLPDMFLSMFVPSFSVAIVSRDE